MTNILEFPEVEEPHGYMTEDGKIIGVYYTKAGKHIEMLLDGEIPQDDLKTLMIMWLALVAPEILKEDEE